MKRIPCHILSLTLVGLLSSTAVGQLHFSKNAEQKSTEITLQPVRRHGVDAAILYSDIVVPAAAIGFGVTVAPGVGPVIAQPFTSRGDLDRLRPLDPGDDGDADTYRSFDIVDNGEGDLDPAWER